MELVEDVASIESDWDALADRLGATPFARPGWILAWQRAFGAGRPAYLVLRRDDRLAGLVPLQLERGVAAAPANWHTPLFELLAEDDAAAGELAGGLLAQAPLTIDLTMIDPAAVGTTALTRSAEEAGFGLIARTVTLSPYVPIVGAFDDFMADLDRKFKKEIGRRWRRLAAGGDVEVSFESGGERLDELLDDGFRVEGSGWKSEEGTAILSDARLERFYREVAHWAADRGWLRLAFLRLDGRALAFDFCIEAGGVHYVPKGGFDVEYRKHGPGQLLTHAGIRRAFELGLDSYELLGQQDEYKRQWTAHAHERIRLQAFPRRPAGSAAYVAWRYGRPLARAVLRRGRADPS